MKHSRDERKARQIRGAKRSLIKKELEHKTPSAMYNLKFATLQSHELESGKRDAVGSSPNVFQKISSEANIDKISHRNLIMSLLTLDKECMLNQ